MTLYKLVGTLNDSTLEQCKPLMFIWATLVKKKKLRFVKTIGNWESQCKVLLWYSWSSYLLQNCSSGHCVVLWKCFSLLSI